jgi:hypothetical protein
MRMRFLAFMLFIFFTSITANAQWLTGKVLAESGSRAAGVSVKFTNAANSISTNPDGSFKIFAPNLPDTLVFSAEGMEPYTVVITEKNIKDPDFEVVLLDKRKVVSELSGVSSGLKASKRETALLTSTSSGYVIGSLDVATSPGSEIRLSTEMSFKYDSVKRAIMARSRILTAGEVNDFKKWKRWEDYSDAEFKEQSTYWGIKTLDRYSVQVTDNAGNAVINEKVFLINKLNGDTAWQAYTDNTGKAELWADFTKNAVKDGYQIIDSRGNKITRPTTFENGMNFIVSNKPCKGSNEIDIAFVVDATGSMADEIEFLKLELEDVIRKSTAKYSDLNLNTAAVFYRDKGDEYVAKHSPFADDILKVLNFIKLQGADGGGDFPEALDTALDVALTKLKWNPESRTRLLFLVLDAPPHMEAMESIQKSILRAARMGVRIIPIACSGIDKSAEYLLRTMALATNGTYSFLTNHSGVGLPHIEPTTDSYEVEILNDLLQRIIGQFLSAKDCNSKQEELFVKEKDNILEVKIFPNPTAGRLSIESNEEVKELFIADFTGKILMRISGNEKQRKWSVDLAQYPSGSYLVRYITKENKWGSEKVVVMK